MSKCPEDCKHFAYYFNKEGHYIRGTFKYAICRKEKPQQRKAQSGTGPKDCYEKKVDTGLFGGKK